MTILPPLTIITIICGGNAFSLSPLLAGRNLLRMTETSVQNSYQQHSQKDNSIKIERSSGKSGSDDNVIAKNSGKTTISRRGVFGLSGAIAASMPIFAANADPSLISTVQGPIQDVIAPAHWVGQFIGINSDTETWVFPSSSPSEVSSALVEILNELTTERRSKLLIPNFKIGKADSSGVHVLTWTKSEWLDTLDISFKQKNSGCVATASFYATGFLPTSIPLAPVVNLGLFFFPFGSPGPRGEMLQTFRLRAIKGLLDKKLEV